MNLPAGHLSHDAFSVVWRFLIRIVPHGHKPSSGTLNVEVVAKRGRQDHGRRQDCRGGAALFAQAWRDGTIIDAFPTELAPRDLAEAMAMQTRWPAQIGEDIVGWKIAGRPGAPAGRIFASTSFDNGPTLPLPRYAPNIVEFEIGFKLKSDLPPREQPYEREEVAAAADLAINVELVGSRRAGVIERAAAALAAGMPFPDNEAEGFVITADNAGNLGLVNGPVIEDWQHRSLLDITVDLRIDGGESQPLLPKQARASRSTCCFGRRTTCPDAASG